MTEPRSQLTVLLNRAAAGDPAAAADLLPLVYCDLRALAHARMHQEAPGDTLQATALVHEAFLRICGDRESWEGRGHFFSAAAIAMRRILVERARQRKGPQRAALVRIPFDSGAEISASPSGPEADWEALDGALTELEREDPELVRVVHLRYFAGLSIDETARVMNRSPRHIDRDWKCARAWLLDRLSSERP